jgi:hypothetical protein
MTKLAAVPTLDQVAADSSLVRDLPHQALVDLSLRAQGVINACWSALLATGPNGAPAKYAGDRLLTAAETAPLLGVSLKTLYATRDRYPFYVDLDGRPRFSERGLKEFIQMRQQGA